MGELLTPSQHLYVTTDDACLGIAERLATLVADAVREQGRVSIALSGGSTPGFLFPRLVRDFAERIPWSKAVFGFVDERAVGPDDPESNFGQANRALFGPLGIPRTNVHRIEGEVRPVESARDRYEGELHRMFAAMPESTEAIPSRSFDIALLGIGPDGHTGSLFPGAPSLSESSRWVVAEPRPLLEPRVPRITLTLPALAAAGHSLFLVLGRAKRSALGQVLHDPNLGTAEGSLPAARVRSRDGVEWFFDQDAAPPGIPGSLAEKA